MAMDVIRALNHLLAVLFVLILDTVRFLSQSLRSRAALSAENLFLRRPLALYAERRIKARRANDGARLAIVLLSRFLAWKDALTIVKPETLVCWHRKGFRLSWRWKSKRRGRPRLPGEIQRLIVQIADRNVTWGEERIAAELLL
jgi:putative transposase